MKYQHEELIQTTEQKDKRIEELELKHEELIQTTQQKDKRIKELELNQNDLQHDLQTKDRKIQNLESQHEEFIIHVKEQKLRMMKEMKGKADFKVVDPVCPGFCKRNMPLENMIKHMKSCRYIIFDEIRNSCKNISGGYCLKLNKAVDVHFNCLAKVYKLEESRDWFIVKIPLIEKTMFYIMHYSEEETKDMFFYNFKCSDEYNYRKSVTVRCAPLGISTEDAVLNNFTTNIYNTIISFTIYKA